jgi:deoxycytidylate deaminase
MSLAMVASERTTCIKRAVGCVLADAKGRVLSIAYNGVASGVPHCNEGHVIAIASVPANPMPSMADSFSDQKVARFYLDRALEIYPELGAKLGGTLTAPFTRETTVGGHVGISACHHLHACEGHDLPSGQDSCEAIHAEQNAILQCSNPDLIATAYVTTSPCKPCMKLLLNTGCRRIVFHEEHTDPWPKEQWLKAGRLWEKL